VGDRANRRHKPWRVGAHRLPVRRAAIKLRDLRGTWPLTIEWQRLTTEHGPRPRQRSTTPACVRTDRGLGASARTERELPDATEDCKYAVAMAYRIRFVIEQRPRGISHELHLTTAGPPTYRRVAQRMHQLISDVHPALKAFTS
jgi:hypothetical protein